ncbi:hypothetical protein Q9L58_001503 [Maublancomyces gigas]|uniref:Uncharacterized protein n=1 Tax=Discina gigas TaxID=1032678 RepID=A0ABR3GU88_9PEZI
MEDSNETPQPFTQGLFNTEPDDMESKKPIISNSLWDIIGWHKWGVLSVSVSIVLLTLNFRRHPIGGEVGNNAKATADILGALQLAVKAHELTIVASLVAIAKQWIHGNLMDLDSGLPLGLLGAEKELAAPFFVISRGYLASVRHVWNIWHRRGREIPVDSKPKRMVWPLLVFLFAACGISALAGPASGVLMIPRVDWFFERDYPFPRVRGMTYPHILIDYRPDNSTYFEIAVELLVPNVTLTTDHWTDSRYTSAIFGPVKVKEIRHRFSDPLGPLAVNTSTTWDRMLDDNHTGNTQATIVMDSDRTWLNWGLNNAVNSTNTTNLSGAGVDHSKILDSWLGRKYVVNAHGIVTNVSCSAKPKLQCLSSPSGNRTSSTWCYMSGTTSDPMAAPLEARNLLLIAEHPSEIRDNKTMLDRVYITEGPQKRNDPKFSASLVVVFDVGWIPVDAPTRDSYTQFDIPSENVTVCSITAEILSVVASSLEIPLRFEFVDMNKTSSNSLIFHEHWLDTIHTTELNRDGDLVSPVTAEFVPPRNMSFLTPNNALLALGETLLPPRGSIEEGDRAAAIVEVPVAGVFAYTFSTLYPSITQYPLGVGEILPDDLKPEPLRNSTQIETVTVHVYDLGYGFQLSSRTGKLGVTVLIAHAFIVLLGSLWQLFWERKVISAWGTIPEYVSLALGSSMPPKLEDTCAGIASTQTLKSIVKVGETTENHLEICTIGEKVDMKPVLDRFGYKYGSQV